VSDLRQRIQSESRCTSVVKQNQLWCGDCKFRHQTYRAGDISSCYQYEEKPNQVLLGGECPEYKKDI
jgi:hypothetical protein